MIFSTWLNQNRKGELQNRPSLVRLRAQIYLLVHEIFYMAEPKKEKENYERGRVWRGCGPRYTYLLSAKCSTCNRFTLSLTMKNTDLILEPISGRGFWISNLWFWFISQKILKKEIEHFYVIFTLSWI